MMSVKRYTVFPGQFIITSVPATIVTVLGSCVSVCLFEKDLRLAGMNHYLLPGNEEDKAGNPNRGLTSTRMLIRSMLNRKSMIENLEAKIFGGCNSLYKDNDMFKIGERNVVVAKEILNEHGIPVVAQHIGGSQGRRIELNSDTGKVRLQLLKETYIEINEEINKGFGH